MGTDTAPSSDVVTKVKQTDSMQPGVHQGNSSVFIWYGRNMLPRSATSHSVRVLMVSHAYDFNGGSEFGFRDVMLGLREIYPDIDVVAVYPRAGDMSADAARRNVRTIIARTPWWVFIDQVRTIRKIRQGIVLVVATAQAVCLVSRVRPTIVLSNTMVCPSFAFAAKLLGKPHYWMIREFGRDDHGFQFLLGYRGTIRLIGRLSQLVICNSRAVEKSMRVLDREMATCVVYPAIDAVPVMPPKRRGRGRFRAVLIGYFAPSKGQDIAIKAVAAARGAAGVDIELVLVGAGDHAQLRKLSQSLHVDDLVSFHGQTRDVRQYWSEAHVGLMCSNCEAFGRVTVEAMAAGLPVCGTDAGGTPEIIIPGLNGLLSPSGDWNALAENLVRLASDEDLRMELALGAARTAHNFGRGRLSSGLSKIFDSVLKGDTSQDRH